MDLKDIISLYDSTEAHQLNYWNIYWLVAIGIFAFLWKEPRSKSLKWVLVSGFIAFCVANLLVIAKLQSRIISLESGINDHLSKLKNEVPSDFVTALINNYLSKPQKAVPTEFVTALKMNSISLEAVVMFHLSITIAFIVAMSFASVISNEDASKNILPK